MNKLLGFIFFTLALIWSWNVIHTPSAIGFETHAAIQDKLATLIFETLQAKKPEAKEVEIIKLWTQTLEENKIIAYFSYRFLEPTADQSQDFIQVIEGEAILHREPSDDFRTDPWIIQSVKTTADFMSFTEGAVITPYGEREIDPTAPADTGLGLEQTGDQ